VKRTDCGLVLSPFVDAGTARPVRRPAPESGKGAPRVQYYSCRDEHAPCLRVFVQVFPVCSV